MNTLDTPSPVELTNLLLDVIRMAYLPEGGGLASYLGSGECPILRYISKHFGCGVTRWHIYDRDTDELQLFHQISGCGIEPAWMKVTDWDRSSNTYDFDFLDANKREALTTKLAKLEAEGNVKSAVKCYRSFFGGTWFVSEFERNNNCLFVRRGEMLASCFEWALRQAVTEILRSRYQSRQIPKCGFRSIDGREALIELGNSGLKSVIESGIRELSTGVVDQDATESIAAIKEWVHDLSISQINAHYTTPLFTEVNHRKDERSDWVSAILSCDLMSSIALVTDWEGIAMLMLLHGDYLFDPATGRDTNFAAFESRLRFSPAMEILLGSRSLVLSPLWFGRRSNASIDIRNSPYVAFVIANFYNDEAVIHGIDTLRCLFALLATPNIIEHGIRYYETQMMVRAAGHDLRNPLSQALRALRDARKEIPEDASALKEHLVGAERSVSTAMLRAKNMLDSVRIGYIKHREVDIVEIVSKSVERVRDSDPCIDKSLRIEVSVPDSGPVKMDPDIVMRCIENILLNAVEASPPREMIKVAVTRDGNVLKVVVKDNGSGMSDDVFSAISEHRIVTTKAPSSKSLSATSRGIGLLATRNALAAHGGELSIPERGRQGTSIVMTFSLEETNTNL